MPSNPVRRRFFRPYIQAIHIYCTSSPQQHLLGHFVGGPRNRRGRHVENDSGLEPAGERPDAALLVHGAHGAGEAGDVSQRRVGGNALGLEGGLDAIERIGQRSSDAAGHPARHTVEVGVVGVGGVQQRRRVLVETKVQRGKRNVGEKRGGVRDVEGGKPFFLIYVAGVQQEPGQRQLARVGGCLHSLLEHVERRHQGVRCNCCSNSRPAGDQRVGFVGDDLQGLRRVGQAVDQEGFGGLEH